MSVQSCVNTRLFFKNEQEMQDTIHHLSQDIYKFNAQALHKIETIRGFCIEIAEQSTLLMKENSVLNLTLRRDISEAERCSKRCRDNLNITIAKNVRDIAIQKKEIKGMCRQAAVLIKDEALEKQVQMIEGKIEEKMQQIRGLFSVDQQEHVAALFKELHKLEKLECSARKEFECHFSSQGDL